MYEQITIKTLYNQGVKKAQIARTLNCHRNTVNNVHERDQPINKYTRKKSSGFDAYREQIEEWLHIKITKRRIFELGSF